MTMELNELILQRLKARNEREKGGIAKVVNSNARLLSQVQQLKLRCTEQEKTETELRTEILELKQKRSTSVATEEQLQHNVEVQKALATLLTERGEKITEISELKGKVQDYERQLNSKEATILSLESKIEELERKSGRLQGSVDELSATNQMLKDEQQALQLEFVILQEKHTLLNKDHEDLVDRWLAMMNKMADSQNREMEEFQEKKQQKIQRELQAAASNVVKVSEGPRTSTSCFVVSVPTKNLHSLDVHDSEVNAVRFSPSGRVFATAGADRKVKLWEIVNHKIQSKGMLTGSNGGVMSVDFDMEPETMILAASNDFACHIWNIEDQRHRHTLTGHSSKVFCAKFMEDSTKVVSGSHDRTLKQWDLRERACVRTMFAGSSCNSVVTFGSLVISGHFDKKVRFWDKRADQAANEILLHGKITSLDLSADRNKLLCCTREPSLKLVDLRMNQVISTYTAPSFHIGTDYTKAIFSPDSEYVCCGSTDGLVYIWSVSKSKIEQTLKDHTHSVLSCSWSPSGNYLMSVDSRKKAILWSDF